MDRPNNVLIYDAANMNPNVAVLDWAGLKHYCFANDGIHLRPDGRHYYARLIDEILRSE